MRAKTLDFCVPFFFVFFFLYFIFLVGVLCRSAPKPNSTGEMFVCLSLCKNWKARATFVELTYKLLPYYLVGLLQIWQAAHFLSKYIFLRFQAALETHAVDVLH